MRDGWRGLRLFGHWEDVSIQGTVRTYRLYACHQLDRLLTGGIILAVWAAFFFFCVCRASNPHTMGVLLYKKWIVYLPTDKGETLRMFLLWMAIPTIAVCISQHQEHRKQQRILQGELTARQGVLTKIGYRRRSRSTIRQYRFLLEIHCPYGKTLYEVYEMPVGFPKAFEEERDMRACRVELALLPPQKQRKSYETLPDPYIDRLSMQVEHIFCIEPLPIRCDPEEWLLFPGYKTVQARKGK